jgi:2-polyprenyl-6-methoxyphenol hydroxylase-like FAD-dependent oxidoreductase
VLKTQLDFSECDSRFPFTLLLPQTTTEELLEARALELGVEMRRGELVETVQPDVGGMIVEGQGTGCPFRYYARYVVGADGARSLMRKSAGIEFQGYPARHAMMLGDVILDAPPSQPLLTLVNEAGGLVVAPRGDGTHYRLIVIDASATSVISTEPVTLAELATATARIAGVDLRPRDPVWLSRFTDETRLA